jgi:hypothetical protein
MGKFNREVTIADRTKAVLYNAGGLGPIGAVYRVTSSDIEEFIYKVFKENGVDADSDDVDIAMKIRWNSEFNNVMRRKQIDAKIDPFTVTIGFSPERKNRKGNQQQKGEKLTVGDRYASQQLSQIMYDENEKMQVSINSNEAVNNAVAIFRKNGKVKWKIGSKKERIVKCNLNTTLILAKFFGFDQDVCSGFEWSLDFNDAKGPNTMKDRRAHYGNGRNGGFTDRFTMEIVKKLQDNNVKKSKRNKDIKKFL